MTLTEFYLQVNGNYDEVKSRLMSDERILKYLKKFPASGDFENLQTALAAEQWQDAFRFSHNLKGMCLNLGLQSLFVPSSALCENLRSGAPVEPCGPLMAAVEEQFRATCQAIAAL